MPAARTSQGAGRSSTSLRTTSGLLSYGLPLVTEICLIDSVAGSLCDMRRISTLAARALLTIASAAAIYGQTTIAVIPGSAPNERFGMSPISLGDVNGDGRPDIAVGAPGVGGSNPQSTGLVRVLSGFDFQVLYVVVGTTLGDRFGSQLAKLDDVDGDGVSDFVVAAPGTGNPMLPGYVRTVSGATGATIRTTVAPGGTAFGWYLAAGGDFDGDGYDDFAVSGWYAPQKVGVYSGLSGALLYAVTSTTYGVLPGNLVSTFVSDRNADGFDELLIGVRDFCAPPCANWYFGAVFLAGGPTGTLLSAHYSNASNQLGHNVASVGDLNEDGVSDIILTSAPFNLLPFSGYSYAHDGVTGAPLWAVFSSAPSATRGAQGSSIVSLGDVDGDLTDDVAFGSSGPRDWTGLTGLSVVSGATGATIYTVASGPLGFYVGAGGDLTGDGRNELLAGDTVTDVPFVDCGSLSIISISTLPAATVVPIGGACGSLFGGPLLGSSPPVLGGAASFTLANGPAFATGNLVFDVGFDVALPIGPCTLHLDVAHIADWILLPIVLDANGALSFGLPLPSIPLLAGFPVTVQAFLLGTPGPFGFDLSNGLLTTLGF